MKPFYKKSLLAFTVLAVVALAVWIYLSQGLNAEIKSELKEGKSLVLYFSADWCGSCKKQKPLLEAVKEEFPKLLFYDIGSNLNKVSKKLLFKQYQVSGIPTFILFKDGKELERLQGIQDREALRSHFSNLD